MSESALSTYRKISPNKDSPRNHSIDTITIHCMVAQWTAKQAADYFANKSVACSPNYSVGKDGSISQSVSESDRSWCSSSASNDNRAITIEVASDMQEPFAVTKEAYEALINLVTDVCKRNGIKKLVWSTNKADRINHRNGCNMTLHRDLNKNKSCPGAYLYNLHQDIANRVNAKLSEETKVYGWDRGQWVQFLGNRHYGSSMADASKPAQPCEAKITNTHPKGKHQFHLVGTHVYGWVDKEQVQIPTDYKAKISKNIHIHKEPSDSSPLGAAISVTAIYTIVAEQNGYGKLKSGAGWIKLTELTRLP